MEYGVVRSHQASSPPVKVSAIGIGRVRVEEYDLAIDSEQSLARLKDVENDAVGDGRSHRVGVNSSQRPQYLKGSPTQSIIQLNSYISTKSTA